MKSLKKPTGRRLTGEILLMVLLAVCFVITTAALVFSEVRIEQNRFATGTVSIDLNGGKPVISQQEFLFEPGMRVQKEFTLTNTGTGDAYCRLRFAQLQGGLQTLLRVTLQDGETLLFTGTPEQLQKESTRAFPLCSGEEKTLRITFEYPAESGNASQNESLSFELTAEAVQQKNNPTAEFN